MQKKKNNNNNKKTVNHFHNVQSRKKRGPGQDLSLRYLTAMTCTIPQGHKDMVIRKVKF